MKIIRKQPGKFVVWGAVLLAVSLLLVWSAWSFAVSEERTIHIFPAEVESVGWEGEEQALEQALSGGALITDFNTKNSAFIILDGNEDETNKATTTDETESEEEVISPDVWDESTPDDSAVTDAPDVVESATTTDEQATTSGSVSFETIEKTNTWLTVAGAFTMRAYGGLSKFVVQEVYAQTDAELTQNDAEQTLTVEEVEEESTKEEEPVEEPEEVEPAQEEPVEEETDAEQTRTNGHDTENDVEESETEANAEAPEETEEPETTESSDQTATVLDALPEGDEQEAATTTTEESSPEEANLELEIIPGEEETPELELDVVETTTEQSTQQATSSEDTTSETEEASADDSGTSTEDEATPPSGQDDETQSESSGGSSSNESDENENDEADQAGSTGGSDEDETDSPVNEDVTICSVTGDPCHVLEFAGCSIGTPPENNIQNIGLRLSFGAEAENGFTDDKLYIRYFTNNSWHLAGEVTINGTFANNSNGDHFSFGLPELAVWEDLEDLKIQLEFVRNSDSTTKIYLDGLWLDTTYEVDFGEEGIDETEDNVADELQALEESASPDILIIDEGEKIEFDYTDDTRDENLIIKTDEQFYSGITKAKVFFNVTNTSDKSDDFHLMAHFPHTKGRMTSLKKWTKNVPKKVEVPEYAEVAHFCEANWRLAETDEHASSTEAVEEVEEVASQDSGETPEETNEEPVALDPEEFGRGGTLEDGTETAEDLTQNDEEQTSTETEVQEEVVEALHSPEGESGEEEIVLEITPEVEDNEELSDEIETVTETTTPAVTEVATTTEEETIEESSPEIEENEAETSTTTAEEISTSTQPTQENTEGETQTEESSTSGSGGGSSDDETDEEVTEDEDLTPEELREFIEETARDLLEDVESNTGTSTARASYYCPTLSEYRVCDSVNTDGTNCIVSQEQIGSEEVIEYVDKWMEVGIQEGEAPVEQSAWTKLSRLFSEDSLPRKEVDPAFTVKESTEDVHRIEAGQTLYFEMEIYFPPQTDGEFWIEAIGKKGTYGLLDPWWDSSWSYRLPITIDNSNNSNELTDYQVYLELDSSLTDLWSNIQSDGDDIRFLSQVDGIGPWLNSSWTYRVPIEINPNRVGSTLTDFPVYVDLSDLGGHFFSNLNSDGGDIRVTTSNGTSEVPREVVFASTTLMTGELHFRADSVSSSATTTFYIYYGNSGASDYASTTLYGSRNVWTNGYDYVHHYHEDPSVSAPQMRDSTVNENHGTVSGGGVDSGDSVAGKLGNAIDFANGLDYITNNSSDSQSYTYTAWIETDSGGYFNGTAANDTNGTYFVDRQSGGEGMASLKAVGNNFTHQYRTDNSTGNPAGIQGNAILTDTWQYVAWGRASSSELFIFTDNASTSIADVSSSITPGDPIYGVSASTSDIFSGLMDEVRFSTVARNEAWLSAEYVNQASSTNFYGTSTFDTYTPDQFTELDYWLQYLETGAATSADIWLQVDTVPANSSTTIYLYYGNAGAAAASDPFTPFTHATLTDMYHVTRDDFGGSDNLEIYSLVDDNEVQLNDGTITALDEGDGVSYGTFTATSVVRALGPIAAHLDMSGGSNGDSLVPKAFATTTFVVSPRNNNTENFFFYSPFGSTSVQVYDGASASPGINFSVATGTGNSSTLVINNGNSAVIESSIPVMMAYEYQTGDGMTPYPATTRDLYGIDSSSVYVGMSSTTDYDVACSGGGSTSVTGAARGSNTNQGACTGGAAGTGNVVRLYNITNPTHANQNADADGGEASVFWPKMEFASRYMVPVDTSYIAIGCPEGNGDVNLQMYDNTGTPSGSPVTCSPPSATEPGKAYFGDDDTINFNPGYFVESTDSPAKPFYAYYEDHTDVGSGSNGGDEANFTSAVQSRQYTYPHPKYSIGSQEVSTAPTYSQDNFRFYANTDAILPTDPWPVGGEDSSEGQSAIAARSTDDGDLLRLRMSVGVTVSTSSAGDIDFKLQHAVKTGDDCTPDLAWLDVGEIGSTTAALRGYNNASVADGATLSSLVLTNTDVLGTYEEENNSAATPNQIGVDEYMEFDWVIENNNAPLDTTYCMRMVRSDGNGLNTYNEYPEIATNGAPNKTAISDPFDNEKVPSVAPALEFAAIDDQEDDVDYLLYIATSSTFSSSTMVVSDNSVANPTRFANITIPSDKAPFDSGNTVSYTLQSNLTDGETYWMQVRSNDRNGSGQWGEWSTSTSFTIDTAITVSTWFQTTGEQFATNQLTGATSSTVGEDARMLDGLGEYGTVDIDGETWTTVNLQNTYTNPVVVASTRYFVDANVTATTPRDARVRNKTSTSFQIKPDTIAAATIVGTTTLDYIVMEAGTWTIDNGTTTGQQVVAGTVENITFCDDAYNSTASYSQVTFDPAFAGTPVVLSTVSTERDASEWFTTSVNDGSTVATEVSSTNMGVALGVTRQTCPGSVDEDIDYVVLDSTATTFLSTNNNVEYSVVDETDISCCGAPDSLTFTPNFSDAPEVVVVGQSGTNGGDGSWALVSTSTAPSASTAFIEVDEMEITATGRSHTTETAGVWAFNAASGTIRASASVVSGAIDFDQADIGNKWGELAWTDDESTGDITYQIQYKTGTTWALIPDNDLPGNSAGTSTSPIPLGDVDTIDYNIIRLVANLSSTSTTPLLQDWTLSWTQGVFTPTSTSPFDNEKIATRTPTFTFQTVDPEGEDLQYEFSFSTSSDFTASTTYRSGVHVGFENPASSTDTSPFISGDSITYTIQPADILATTTYWWRTRARDPAGDNAWSFWSQEQSFTVDESVTLSTWFQTTQDQFNTDTLTGVEANSSGNVVTRVNLGEYGQAHLPANTWTTITTQNEYQNPIVVASPRYYANSTGGSVQRSAQVRNRMNNSFEMILHNNAGTSFATTVVDYIVMEEGEWTIEDGSSGIQVIAGEHTTNTCQTSSYNDTSLDTVTFSTPFNAAPAVLATINSFNNAAWAVSFASNDGDKDTPPTATAMGVAVGRGAAGCGPISLAETTGYIAFEKVHGTNNGVEFDTNSGPEGPACCDANGYAQPFTGTFSSAPPLAVVNHVTMDGAQGGWALTATSTSIGTTTDTTDHYVSMDESVGADRGHATEDIAVVAFADNEGIIQRVGGDLSGSITGTAIDFDNGTGPKWGDVFWTASTTGSSTFLVQVEYFNTASSAWLLVPNDDLPDNSTGTSSSPIDISTLGFSTFNMIRPVGNFQCDSGDCPFLEDWTVDWSEGLTLTGTIREYDRTTNVNSGTVAVALNGVLQVGRTGTISSGTWTINNVNAFPNDVITVFVDDAATSSRAVAVTVASNAGQDISGIDLYEQHLAIGSDEDTTVTNVDLGLFDNNGSGNDFDIFHEVDAGNDLAVCFTDGCHHANMIIKGGNTYRPDSSSSGDVDTHDMVINGFFLPDDNTVTVNGSWDNNNAFGSAMSSIVFTATSGVEIINSMGSATSTFNDVTFGQGAGSAVFQLDDHLDVDGNLLVDYGVLLASTSDIMIAGNLTINANGGFQKGIGSTTGTTTFDGTGAINWTDNTTPKQDMGDVIASGTTKTIQLQTDVRVTNILIQTGNTIDPTGSDNTLIVRGNFTNNGVYTPRNAEVRFTATTTGHVITPGVSSFYDIRFDGIGGNWAFGQSTMTALNDFIIDNGIVTLASATTTLSGSFSNDGGSFMHNNAVVLFDATASGNTITASSSDFYTMHFNGASGEWSFTDTNATTSNNITFQNGNLIMPSGQFTIGGDMNTISGTFDPNNGEVKFTTGSTEENIRAGSNEFYDMRFSGSGSGGWYGSGWTYRLGVTIQNSQVSEDLTDFPVYVDLANMGGQFFSNLNSDGGDIRVTRSDGTTEVAREVVVASTTLQTGELHFKANSLSSTTDTTFYIYYGNSGASDYASSSTYGSQNVWTNGYEFVWHLQEDPGGAAPQFIDSTGNGYDGTGTGLISADSVTGKFGAGIDFSSASDYIDGGIDTLVDFTYTLWSYTNTINANTFYTDRTSGTARASIFTSGGNYTFRNTDDFGGTTDVTGSAITADKWDYIAWGNKKSPDSAFIVVDLASTSQFVDFTFGLTPPPPRLAAFQSGGLDVDATIDEFRLASTTRSEGWLNTEYRNQSTSTDFYATSSAETQVSRVFLDTNATANRNVAIDSGLVTFPSGTFTIGGSFTNLGAFMPNNGLVSFDSTLSGNTVNAGDSSFYDVEFDNALGEWTVTNHATATNIWRITDARDFTVNSGQRVEVTGTFINSLHSASTTWTGSTLALTSGTNYTVGSESLPVEIYGTLEIGPTTDIRMWNSTASDFAVNQTGSLYSQDHAAIDGELYIFGDYDRTTGTDYWSANTNFDGAALAGANRRAVSVFIATSTTVDFTGVGTTLQILGTSTATTTIQNQVSGSYDLTVRDATVNAAYFAASDMATTGVRILGSSTVTAFYPASFALGTNNGSALTVSSTTIDANAAYQLFNVSFATTSTALFGNNVTASGTAVSYWWFRDSYGGFDGEFNDNDAGDPGDIRWDDSAFSVDVSGTVYLDEGTTHAGGILCDDFTPVITLIVDGDGGTPYTAACASADGTYTINTVGYTGDATFIAYLSGTSSYASTITRTPTVNITDFDIYADHVIVRNEDSSPMTIANMALYDNVDDPDIPFTAATGSPDTLSVEPEIALLVWSNDEFAPGGNVTLNSGGSGDSWDGTLRLQTNSTFTAAGTESHSVGGDWRADSGTTFTRASSTVTFTATTSLKRIQAPDTFNNIVFNGAGGVWNIDEALTAEYNFSVNAGTTTGTSSVTVLKGIVTGDGEINFTGGTVSINESGNFGGANDWAFANLTLGDGSNATTTKIGANDITIRNVLTISSNHVLEAGDDIWTFVGTGTVFTPTGVFNPQTSTTTYASTSAMTVAATGYNNLVLAPTGAGSPTYTMAAGGINASSSVYIGDGTNPVTVTANTNDPLIDIEGNLNILANGTFVSASANDIRIAGSYVNQGTLTAPSGGTFVFDSGDTGETIDAGNSSFANVSFNNASGGWTILDHATSTENWSIAAASNFTQTSGTTLEVRGEFTNNVGGAATTWTGSTLHLTSETNYTLNNKTDTGDDYNIFKVSSSTDIRMWNSSSTLYDIAADSSLYSQDHDSVNGDLYIFGQYTHATSTDYWSYATDFDGAALGGSPRQANVYIASSSVLDFTTGGALEIIGATTSPATTTIQNQGAGTYSMTVSGGSIDAQVYQIRDINGDGLQFTGAPTVTDLSYGDYLLDIDNGTMMTVDASAINANTLKTFRQNIFATTTNAATGTNVLVNGSPGSSWRFTLAYGNLAGEKFDADPDGVSGDPGVIVWDDSDANITVSGNVYSDEGDTAMGASICDGSTTTIQLEVSSGATIASTTCALGTGFYQFTNVVFNDGDSLTVYIDSAGGERAITTTIEPITFITDFDLYQDRVIVRHEDTNPITIDNLTFLDSDQDPDIPYDAESGAPDTLVLIPNTKLLIWPGKTFTPGGNVTLNSGGSGDTWDGTLHIGTSSTFVAAGTESHSIGGSWLTYPSASFTRASSTVTFTATTTGKTISPDQSEFFNVTFNGSGGAWDFVDIHATATNDVTITTGSVTLASTTMTVGGSLANTGGSFDAGSTTLKFTSTNPETIEVNGSDTHNLIFQGGGTYTYVDTLATTTGDVSITNGTTTFPGATMVVGGSFSNSGGMFDTASLFRFTSNGAGETIAFNGSNVHDLTFDGSASWNITDTHATATGDVIITSGSVAVPTGSFGVGGSFDNNALASSYNANGGLMYFFATSTGHTVDPNGALFANVEFDSGTGGWTVQSATSSGYWTISGASNYTQASLSDLEVQDIFTNLVGGSATVWSGSRLYLNASGTSYTINTKALGGDQYQTLELGIHTDVRMWNSAGTTTVVHASSSLYSQDHMAVDGDLYIWGEYIRASGNDYWSYATDFDGTALGGSPRQVDVRIATGSELSFSGGQLRIVGDSLASTTIDVQGTGNYALHVFNGTFEAQYYQVRNTDGQGLYISGTPTIVELEFGDFELSVDGGTMMTVASTTLDANPTQTWDRMRFATSTGINAGYNIVRSGTSSNTWTFTNEYGNYASEAFDLDGIDLCSSFRWTDSTCLETSQSHYRFRNDDGGEGVPNDEWFDTSWSHRQRVTIFNTISNDLVNQPIQIEVAYDGDMQNDFDDLRFTDVSGTNTLSYWIENIDGTAPNATATVWINVPYVVGDGTAPVFMYYGNAGVSTADSGTTTFPLFFDDFEDNNITEYSGDTGQFSVSTSFNYEGTYGLAGTVAGKTTDGIFTGAGGTSTATGTTMRWFQYLDDAADDEPCTLFGVQNPGTDNNNYAVCLDQFSGDSLAISEDVESNEEDGGGTVLVRETASYGTGWYEVEVDWLANSDIVANVYSATSGELIVGTSTNDTTYGSGGVGFSYWFQSGGWDAFMVRPYIASEPTIRFSLEQGRNGATWSEPQDTALSSQVAESNFRIRMSVENSGPPISSQNFRLQYASKTGYATCEGVPGTDFNDVKGTGCGVGDDICMTASAQFTDQAVTTQHLDTDFDGDMVAGRMVEATSNETNNIDIATNHFTEVEYSIEMTTEATDPSYCLRVTDGGLELDNYARVPEIRGRFVPIITNWNLNNDQDIVLTEGTTTAVVATGTISDSNGYTDIVVSTTTVHRSGVAGAETCSADDNNCYRLASSTDECSLSNCSGNSCDITCTLDMQYFAERTDAGTYVAEDWSAFLYVEDSAGDVSTTTSLGVEVLTTRALDITTNDIDFGTLNVGDDTGAVNSTSTLQNTGNENIDIDVAGSDLSASGSTIPVGNVKYASSTFTYSACSICNFLATTTSSFEVDLGKATSSSTPVTDDLYWGIAIPSNTGGLQHYGTTSFTAIGD